MDNLIKYFDTIESGFRRMKFLTLSAVTLAVAVPSVSIALSYGFVNSRTGSVYVVNGGEASLARLSDGESVRDLEVKDHVSRFHELMFNLAPSTDAVERNIGKAMSFCDKSGYDYYQMLSETDFYARLIAANASQQIAIDSMAVNMGVYPYEAEVMGKLYVMRQSSITAYDFKSRCSLVNIERSESNPHGLMIEKFRVVRNRQIGTRQRN